MKKQKGFTLIELLVVIAIIAILSTVVMAGLNSARAKGRDAKRLSDVKSVQAALELFFDTCQGYPNVVAMLTTGTNTTAAGACASSFGTFLATIPTNPNPGGEAYTYCGDAAITAPAAVNPVAGCAAGSASYRIGFNLEGQAGSLAAGDHQAAPSGML